MGSTRRTFAQPRVHVNSRVREIPSENPRAVNLCLKMTRRSFRFRYSVGFQAVGSVFFLFFFASSPPWVFGAVGQLISPIKIIDLEVSSKIRVMILIDKADQYFEGLKFPLFGFLSWTGTILFFFLPGKKNTERNEKERWCINFVGSLFYYE